MTNGVKKGILVRIAYVAVQDVQVNRPQVYALLRSVLNESHRDSAPRALHALSLLSQLLSEANGSTFHFGPRSTSPTGTQRRSAHSEIKKFILSQTSLHSLIFHFADVLNCYG